MSRGSNTESGSNAKEYETFHDWAALLNTPAGNSYASSSLFFRGSIDPFNGYQPSSSYFGSHRHIRSYVSSLYLKNLLHRKIISPFSDYSLICHVYKRVNQKNKKIWDEKFVTIFQICTRLSRMDGRYSIRAVEINFSSEICEKTSKICVKMTFF